MGKGNSSLRCCLACVLPCGALDMIRIVHPNGWVEELTGRVTAADILRDNPNHVLTEPRSHGVSCRRILIVESGSDLKKGSIYFLVPVSSSAPPVKGKRDSSKPPCRGRKAAWRPHLTSISEEFVTNIGFN